MVKNLLQNPWLRLSLISLGGILIVGLVQTMFMSLLSPQTPQASQGMQMSGSGQGMGMGMMGGMDGMGMMGGMGGMSSGGGMSGMSSGSLFGSFFSSILTVLIILAVIALFVGLIGLGYKFIKNNIQPKSETQVKTKTVENKIVQP